MIFELLKLIFPDKKDKRDYKAKDADFNKVRFSDIPLRSSEARFDPIARNQEHRGICVSERVRSCAEAFYNETEGVRTTKLSPEFINYFAEQWDNHPPEGTSPRLGCKALKTKGIPLYDLYPTQESFSAVKPPASNVLLDAQRRRCEGYYRASTVEQVCKAIAQNEVNRNAGISNRLYVGGSFKVFHSSLFSPGMRVLGMPMKYERAMLHDMRIVDYDLEKKMFKIRNSYGMEFGDCGYFWMPFAYFRKYKVDIWVIEFMD
jgi:hypothetical protein